MMEQESEGKVTVRLDLEGEAAKDFLTLLKKRGLTQNTQLVRQLITEAVNKELKGNESGQNIPTS